MKDLFLGHPRLWISFIAGTALFFFLPHDWSTLSRVLVCWNGGVVLFLVMIFFWMTHLSAEQICTKYIEEDETAPFILAVVIIAAVASLFAIVEPLATIKQVSGDRAVGHRIIVSMLICPLVVHRNTSNSKQKIKNGKKIN